MTVRWRRTAAALGLVALVVGIPSAAAAAPFGVVGDSVTHDARDELAARGATVNSAPGVDIRSGRPGVRDLARRPRRPLVVALGLMDVSFWATQAQLARRLRPVLRDDARGVACVVWVDLKTTSGVHPQWRSRASAFNSLLGDLAAEHGAHIATWSRFSVGHDVWFRPDGHHLTASGQAAYARWLAGRVDHLCG